MYPDIVQKMTLLLAFDLLLEMLMSYEPAWREPTYVILVLDTSSDSRLNSRTEILPTVSPKMTDLLINYRSLMVFRLLYRERAISFPS